jgi:hypothetical protein
MKNKIYITKNRQSNQEILIQSSLKPMIKIVIGNNNYQRKKLSFFMF